jgi:hypothetical protein
MNTTKSMDYRGFIISWREPAMTSAKWTANVTSETPSLFALMGRNGAQAIDGRDRYDMLATAKMYVDSLLDQSTAARAT